MWSQPVRDVGENKLSAKTDCGRQRYDSWFVVVRFDHDSVPERGSGAESSKHLTF